MRSLLLTVFSFALVCGVFFGASTVEAKGLPSFTGYIVPCGQSCDPGGDVAGIRECSTCHLVILVQRILSFLVFLGAVIAVFMFLWAGFTALRATGNVSVIKEAKEKFFNALWGFIIVLSSWLIVDVVISIFYDRDRLGPWNEIVCDNVDVEAPFSGAASCVALDHPGFDSQPAVVPEGTAGMNSERARYCSLCKNAVGQQVQLCREFETRAACESSNQCGAMLALQSCTLGIFTFNPDARVTTSDDEVLDHAGVVERLGITTAASAVDCIAQRSGKPGFCIVEGVDLASTSPQLIEELNRIRRACGCYLHIIASEDARSVVFARHPIETDLKLPDAIDPDDSTSLIESTDVGVVLRLKEDSDSVEEVSESAVEPEAQQPEPTSSETTSVPAINEEDGEVDDPLENDTIADDELNSERERTLATERERAVRDELEIADVLVNQHAVCVADATIDDSCINARDLDRAVIEATKTFSETCTYCDGITIIEGSETGHANQATIVNPGGLPLRTHLDDNYTYVGNDADGRRVYTDESKTTYRLSNDHMEIDILTDTAAEMVLSNITLPPEEQSTDEPPDEPEPPSACSPWNPFCKVAEWWNS